METRAPVNCVRPQRLRRQSDPGVDNRTRLRVGAVFGLFEAGMPLVALALGHVVEGDVGGPSRWLAAGLLVAIGAYQIVHAVRQASDDDSPDVSSAARLRRLWVTGFALSIDNLAIGFVLGTYHVNVVIAIAVIAVVSVGMSLVGLEHRLGRQRGEPETAVAGPALLKAGQTSGAAEHEQRRAEQPPGRTTGKYAEQRHGDVDRHSADRDGDIGVSHRVVPFLVLFQGQESGRDRWTAIRRASRRPAARAGCRSAARQNALVSA